MQHRSSMLEHFLDIYLINLKLAPSAIAMYIVNVQVQKNSFRH